MEQTSIRVRRYNRDRLAALGGMDDKFDDVITRLLDHYEVCPEVAEGQRERSPQPANGAGER